MDDKEFEITEE